MSNAPIFQSIFNTPWENMPQVMQKHYAIRADSDDRVVVEGLMNIHRNWLMRVASPLLRVLGVLAPFDGKDIRTTVTFYSGKGSNFFHFDRVFYFPGRAPFRFHSQLLHVADNEVIEFMQCGVGWRSTFKSEGQKIILGHVGYVWKIGGFIFPLPISWLLGKGAAEEEALTDDKFCMRMTITHPLLGECYRYDGKFRIAEITHA